MRTQHRRKALPTKGSDDVHQCEFSPVSLSQNELPARGRNPEAGDRRATTLGRSPQNGGSLFGGWARV